MHPLIKKLTSKPETISLCWLGNDGWLISYDGHIIGIDIDLCNSLRKSPPVITPEELAPHLDYLFATHDHDDHFNVKTCNMIAKHGPATFLLPKSCTIRQQNSSIPDQRVRWVSPRSDYAFTEWLSCKTVRALHGHIHGSVYEHANTDDCGFLLELGGKTIYHPGDTVLLSEQLDMNDIDILFISPTEHNTCIEDSVLLCESIKPRYIFAQHFDTYEYSDEHAYWVVGYPHEVKTSLSDAIRARMTIPIQGDVYSV